jgi:hypothetical protein
MQIDRSNEPENARASIDEMIQPLSNATCDIVLLQVSYAAYTFSSEDGRQMGVGWGKESWLNAHAAKIATGKARPSYEIH